MSKHQFTTPVGRLISSGLYEPRTTDYDGKPLTVKTGANAGQPRKDFSFGVAFPKTAGATHWAQEAWLRPLWDLAAAAFPNGETQRHDFAWKITDGDSTIPNKQGRKPCEREGFKGHWILWFSGGVAPRIYNADGSQQILEKDAVKPGYFVQVFGNATDNKPSASPGLYINHSMVAFAAYGEEIVFGPDVAAAGFGQGVQLPAGASATPSAAAFNPSAAAVPGAAPLPPGVPGVPVPGAGSVPAVAATVPTGAAFAPAAAAVTPDPSFTAIPGAGAPAGGAGAIPLPPGAGIPTPPPGRVMLPAAQGATYEQLIAKGWTDATLVQHGLMAP